MFALLLTLVAAVICSLLLTAVVCIRRSHLIGIAEIPERIRSLAPSFGILLGVLAVNKGLQDASQSLSLLIDWNITWWIYDREGQLVVAIQNAVPAWMDGYFVFMYVVGYVLLLVFPLIAYGLLRDARFGKEIVLAYAVNYGIGLAFYSVFIAYGPRNILPDLVDQPLFDGYPQVMIITSFVNSNTNVFPSLHTSLSVSAVLLAWRTREYFPIWAGIAPIVGASILVSTMYLGIHWMIDVLVGIALGATSVALAIDIVDRQGSITWPIVKSCRRVIANRRPTVRRR